MQARQVQAATEVAMEEELAGTAGESNVGSERARAMRELQRKNLARAHKEVSHIVPFLLWPTRTFDFASASSLFLL